MALVVVGASLLLFGGPFLLVGVWLVAQSWALQQRGVRTTGTVTALIEHASAGDPDSPMVSFTPAGAQQPVTFRVKLADNRFQRGQSVPVVYDPRRPTNASVAEGRYLWFGPILFVMLGVVFSLMGVGVLVARFFFDVG